MGTQQPIRTVQPLMQRLCFGRSWISLIKRKYGRLMSVTHQEVAATWSYPDQKYFAVFLIFVVALGVPTILSTSFIYTKQYFYRHHICLFYCLFFFCHILRYLLVSVSKRPVHQEMLYKENCTEQNIVIPYAEMVWHLVQTDTQ